MKLEATAPPRRSPHPLREGVPVPTLDPGDPNEHWRKHPSDYHADCATTSLAAAVGEQDALRRQNTLREAQVHAALSLRDAVLEMTATFKEWTLK